MNEQVIVTTQSYTYAKEFGGTNGQDLRIFSEANESIR